MIRLHVVLLDPVAEPSLAPTALGRALVDPALDATVHAGIQAFLQAVPEPEARRVLFCSRTGASTLLALLQPMAGATPWPASLLSPALDPAEHCALVEAGVQAWGDIDAVEGAGLLALLARADARWQRESALRAELAKLRARMDERKWVDKAKGLLMLSRSMAEDEAFALLRRTAMHANLRLGEVSRSVVDAAQWAEAVNRAGQLRMQSQRMARLAAQVMAGIELPRSREQRRRSAERVEQNLAHLEHLELDAGCAEVLGRVRTAWQALLAAWTPRVTAHELASIDAAAEALLASAELLADALQTASGRRALRIVNLCGRQRMLSERIAKDALLASIRVPGSAPELASTAQEFERALVELEQAPLTSPEIRAALLAAREEWLRLARGVQGMNKPKGGVALVRSAEALVETFDQLAVRYEHSLQVILS